IFILLIFVLAASCRPIIPTYLIWRFGYLVPAEMQYSLYEISCQAPAATFYSCFDRKRECGMCVAECLTSLAPQDAHAPAPAGQYVCSEIHHPLPAPAEPNVSPIRPTETRIAADQAY